MPDVLPLRSLPGRRRLVPPKPVNPSVPAMAVPDGYVESIPPLPKKGYLLKELAKDVYFFSNGVYNNLFIVTSGGCHSHRSRFAVPVL